MQHARIDKKKEDVQELYRNFYRTYDPSLCQIILKSLKSPEGNSKNKFKIKELGCGSHFTAWAFTSPSGDSQVLKISHDPTGKSSSWREQSLKTSLVRKILKRLVEVPHGERPSLLPPFELLNSRVLGRDDNPLVMVMPYGRPTSVLQASLKAHWLPLEEEIQLFEAFLKSLGLSLKDQIQIAELGSVPFIYDLSDLSLS
ncbi:MAG: hypothetical protein KA436_07810 [Oligoflexales bacterium]|nr:hypothetical protein [Oligoflexales bacterium]